MKGIIKKSEEQIKYENDFKHVLELTGIALNVEVEKFAIPKPMRPIFGIPLSQANKLLARIKREDMKVLCETPPWNGKDSLDALVDSTNAIKYRPADKASVVLGINSPKSSPPRPTR